MDGPVPLKLENPKVLPVEESSDSETLKQPLKEDFLDPSHPLYGTVDEEGHTTPGNWRDILTVRAFIVAGILGAIFNVISLKLGLTVGSTPNLSIASSLLGWVIMKTMLQLLSRCNITSKPFTRHENTVIQTAAVACYSLGFAGGFSNYIPAMTWNIYLQAKDGAAALASGAQFNLPPAILPAGVLQPTYAQLVAFMALISFSGFIAITPLRKIFIISHRLPYATGTATGVVLNTFHSPESRDKNSSARRQLRLFGWTFIGSFGFSFFKWFFSGQPGGGAKCGFDNFPALGLKAYKFKWYFDFNQLYIGAGFLMPHHIVASMMFGAVISWGLMWPILDGKKGDWYPATLGQGTTDVSGLSGYQIFVAVATILGDGIYNMIKAMTTAGIAMWLEYKKGPELPSWFNRKLAPEANHDISDKWIAAGATSRHVALRDIIFLKDNISSWLVLALYVGLSAISIGVLPQLFSDVKAQYVVVAVLVAPIFAFSNGYGEGLTNSNPLSNYGKITVLIIAAWAGPQGGILASLAVCGVASAVAGAAAELMQDFKTSWITMTSARSMFIAQAVGNTIGCIVSPGIYWMYYKAFNIGDINGAYPAPFGLLYRSIAVLGTEGFDVLPKHCTVFMIVFFVAAIAVNVIRDFLVPKSWRICIPIPMAVGVTFFLGAYFYLDYSIGNLILFIWSLYQPAAAMQDGPVVGSGLIAGDGVWAVPAAILALAKRPPPLCMTFFNSATALRLVKTVKTLT